jgi:glutathione S-transferase
VAVLRAGVVTVQEHRRTLHVRLDLGVVQRDRAFDRPDAQRRGAVLPDLEQLLQPDRIHRDVVKTVDDLGPVVAVGELRRPWRLRMLGHGGILHGETAERCKEFGRIPVAFRQRCANSASEFAPNPGALPMLTLYGVYRSRASRPLWLLAECGAPFTHVPVIQAYRLPDAAAPDAPLNTASAAFLAVNPMGQIPAMTEGDLLLTESLAITLHIARRHGGSFGPATDAELSQMENWALFAATSIETPALEITFAMANGAATEEGAGIVAIAAEKLRRPLARLQAHLATAPLAGGRALYRRRHRRRRMRALCPGASLAAGRIPGRQDLDRDLPGPPGVPEDVGRAAGRTRVRGAVCPPRCVPHLTPRGYSSTEDARQ